MNQEKISKFIKSIRKKENLNQQKFAEKYNVTYQAVSKWENAKNIPDIAILKQMCDEYNMNLDDFLEAKLPKNRIKFKIVVPIFIIIVGVIIATFILINKNDNFEFKTISTSCNNFSLFGSIAYNKNKTSIHISNITYCGGEDNNTYQKIECILYEVDGKLKKEISKYNYSDKKLITLEEFLENVIFNVDHYENTCKIYKENTLHLEIEATTKDNNIIAYKIPLTLKDNC